MKRFVLCCSVIALLFCASAHAAEAPRLFLDVESVGEGVYKAEICVEGLEEEHRLSAVRVCLSYPADRLSCTEWKKGQALYQASFSMTPQYTHSNPAIFIAMDINEALTMEGVLATFTFEVQEGAQGKCLLDLGVIDAVDLDNKPLQLFEISDASIDLGGADAPVDEPIEILPDDGMEVDPNKDTYNTTLPGGAQTPDDPGENSQTGDQSNEAQTHPEDDPAVNETTTNNESALEGIKESLLTDEETKDDAPGQTGENSRKLWWILCAGAAVMALAAVFVIVWRRKNEKNDEQV